MVFDLSTAKPIAQPKQLKVLPIEQIEGGNKVIEANNKWLSTVTTPKMISDWKNKGSIGFLEAADKLNKWEMLPVLNGKTLIDDISVVKSFDSFKKGEILLAISQAESHSWRGERAEFLADR